jgi:hypothetical protein
MTWLNFMSDYKGGHGNFGKWSWDQAIKAGYSGNQIKVALQEQGAAGYLLGSPLRTDYMQHYQGDTHPDNPLGKYQGPKGNFGRAAYNEAKGGGWKAQDIYDEIQSGRSGMQMMGGALDQYYNDLQIERDNAQIARDAEAATATATFRADLLAQQQSAAAEQQRIQEEMAAQAARVKGRSPTGVGGAASVKGSRLSITESGGRKGTKRFARPTQYMNTLGMTSGGTGSAGKSPLNL